MTRVQYSVFDSREAAIAAGWADAEFGDWQESLNGKIRKGWIALDFLTVEQAREDHRDCRSSRPTVASRYSERKQ